MFISEDKQRQIFIAVVSLGLTIFFFFKLDIFFIYISNDIPFPSFLSENPLYTPPPPAPQPTHTPFLVLEFPYTRV